MPHYHYDTPKLSQRVKACRDQQNEYRHRNSTQQQQQHVKCARVPQLTVWKPAAWRWRRYRAVVQAWSIATGETCVRLRRLLRFQARSRLSLTVVHKPHLCLPVPRRHSQQGPSTFQPPRLPLRSAQQYRYAHILQPRRLMLRPSQHSSWSAASQRARTSRALRNRGKLPYTLSHPLLPAWSVAAKNCDRFYPTRYYHTQQDSFGTTVITPHVITPLPYTTRGGE